MGKTKVIELTTEQRKELENGYRDGKTHSFRQRCQMILLKSEKRTSQEVVSILGSCEMTVNNWLKRYEQFALEGLRTREGRGRKSILRAEDLSEVKTRVKASRQKISIAQAELEQSLGKSFSRSTLVRYLKKTIAETPELEKD